MVMSTPEAGADWPEASMLLRMFSTDVAVREVQLAQVFVKQLFTGVPVQESKKLAGKLVRLEQPNQVLLKLVPLEVSIKGKLVRFAQPRQEKPKLVPLEVSIKGKLVRLTQPRQASIKLVTLEVSIKGKLVSWLQLYQVLAKVVPLEVSINGKLVRPLQSRQVLVKLPTPAVTLKAALKSVILFAPDQVFWRVLPTSRSLTSATDVIWSSSVLLLKFGTYC